MILPGVYGWEYYTTPLVDRPFMDLHEQLKPTGIIGHGYGILGTLFMLIGVSTYSIRKRVAVFQRIGKLSHWLNFHIFLCTTGPALVFWHTSMKFQGVVAISFWSMVVVVASGILGRYVYNRIPKDEEGHFKNLSAIGVEKNEIVRELDRYWPEFPTYQSSFGIDTQLMSYQSTFSALIYSIKMDVQSWLHRNAYRSRVQELTLATHEKAEVLRLIKLYKSKNRQQHLLEPLQKIFGYWHVFHIPLATIMFLILAVHIAVSILFGYTWIF